MNYINDANIVNTIVDIEKATFAVAFKLEKIC